MVQDLCLLLLLPSIHNNMFVQELVSRFTLSTIGVTSSEQLVVSYRAFGEKIRVQQ